MTDWIRLLIDIIFWPPLFQLVIAPGLVAALLVVIFIIWFERKTAARVQMRIGPYHISPRLGGFLQLFADLTRYAFQEIIIPTAVDKPIFIGAPLTALVLSLLPVVSMPYTSTPYYYPLPMDYSLLLTVALSTISPIFIVAAGWASNNKFAVIGSLRESFVITAYELLIVITALSGGVAALSYNLVDIVNAQTPFYKWMILTNPIAALTMFAAILMATSGFPFEIPEAENEIVAGAFTEYSGLMYGINMGSAYIKRFVYSLLFTLVFLGGWLPYKPGIHLIDGYIIPLVVVLVKATIVMAIISFLRAVYGRFRIDQALDGAWRIFIPLALIGFGLALLEAYMGVYA
ncbi:MAG: NADH-quinone oxidoreductase subunit NuoH [Desulfurococcales archaeon]|nr:NADH-quinone oxidoreductase subunit NuoH [Desulfurococcales archaeon]